MERFLGLIGWFAKFVQNYAGVVEPLNHSQLKWKDVKWNWDDQCENVFLTINNEIARTVTITTPDISKPFEVNTDASEVGLGQS